jgi:superfamily II DNA/RNA helicase
MIVFTKTKAGADELVVMLKRENLDAEALHSNRSQNVTNTIIRSNSEKIN